MEPPPEESPKADADSPQEVTKRPHWLRRSLWWLWVAVRSVLQVLLITWATLALNYSNLPWPWARLVLAVAFAVFAAWALWVTRRRRMGWAFAGAFGLVVIWFALIPPSHDRPWRPEDGVMPRAVIDGDHVQIDAVRNFHYRTRNDFDVRYEPREFSIAHVTTLDLFISYWSPAEGPVAHTFVSFNFDDGTPPLCISIETRREVGEGFAPIASMFKQFELIYIVGDENDLVGSRSSKRGEQVYLYHIRAQPAGVRLMLREYLRRINELADRPEWYHLLSNNCTINIVRYANASGRTGGFDVRHLLNGWFDRYLYDAGRVDTSMPFDELRRRSKITDVANDAKDAPDFSQRIRAALPPPPE